MEDHRGSWFLNCGAKRIYGWRRERKFGPRSNLSQELNGVFTQWKLTTDYQHKMMQNSKLCIKTKMRGIRVYWIYPRSLTRLMRPGKQGCRNLCLKNVLLLASQSLLFMCKKLLVIFIKLSKSCDKTCFGREEAWYFIRSAKGNTFLRNFGWLSTYYTVLHPRR
jgi:hypothetical protein